MAANGIMRRDRRKKPTRRTMISAGIAYAIGMSAIAMREYERIVAAPAHTNANAQSRPVRVVKP